MRVREGSIRLAEGEEEEEEEEEGGGNGWRYKRVRMGKVLLSWNAGLGATLTAGLGVLIWRYVVEVARGGGC